MRKVALRGPLTQNTTRIVVTGLMTGGQAEHAVQELPTIMDQHYKGKVRNTMTATLPEHMIAGNGYSTAKKSDMHQNPRPDYSSRLCSLGGHIRLFVH